MQLILYRSNKTARSEIVDYRFEVLLSQFRSSRSRFVTDSMRLILSLICVLSKMARGGLGETAFTFLKVTGWNFTQLFWCGPGETAFKIFDRDKVKLHSTVIFLRWLWWVQFDLVRFSNCVCNLTWSSSECLSDVQPSPLHKRKCSFPQSTPILVLG